MNGDIKVFSLRHGAEPSPDDYVRVRVDRTDVLMGNRYRMQLESERDTVCDLYERDLARDMESHGPMYNWCRGLALELQSGTNIALMCWCAPKRCHADAIRAAVLNILAKL